MSPSTTGGIHVAPNIANEGEDSIFSLIPDLCDRTIYEL